MKDRITKKEIMRQITKLEDKLKVIKVKSKKGEEFLININAYLKDSKHWLKEKNYLAFDSKYFSEIENINFCQYEKSLECRLSFPYENQKHIKKKYAKMLF